MVLITHDLLAWLKLLGLDGEMAHAEPKRLRYCLLHTAGAITRSARRARLRLSAPWPWSKQLTDVFANLRALQLRT